MNRSSAIVATNSSDAKLRWYWHLGALGIVIPLVLVMFQFEVAEAIDVWWGYPTYSYCFLIIPISAWLIWEKRRELAQTAPRVFPKAIILLPVLLLIWFIAKVGSINELRQFVVVAIIDVVILAMVGVGIFRAILFPVLYLFFLVPFGQYFIPAMQQFATWFTDLGLSLLGIVHYTEGTIIELPNGRFQIAEACAGLRFLIATIAVGVLFVHLAYRKWWKIAVFLAACVVVPLIANGLRCIGIIVLAYLTNNAAAVAADHIIYGWIFNVIILSVMLFGGMRYRDAADAREEAMASETRRTSPSAVLITAVIALCTIAAGPALAYWYESRAATAANESSTLLSVPLGWTLVPTLSPWHPIYAADDQKWGNSVALTSTNVPTVDMVILYRAQTSEQDFLIATMNRLWDLETWYQVGSNTQNARLGSTPVRFNETILAMKSEKRILWSTYWMDGQFTTSDFRMKLLQFENMFLGRGGALIVFSTPIDGALDDARSRLGSATAMFTNLPTTLEAANVTPDAPYLTH